MKNLKLFFLAIGGVFVLLLPQACTDNFSSLNTDPALVTEDIINPDMLFTQSQKNSVFNSITEGGRIKEYAGMHAASGSGNILTQGNHNNPFNNYYRNFVSPLAESIRLMEGDPVKANKLAIARIWRAWLFSQITDIYGDIPYTKAAQDIESEVVQPAYDSQEFIYRDLLSELKEAVEQLEETNQRESFGGQDILYNGDLAMWERFGNSLRLRLALRVHFADRELAEEHISEVVNEPLIEDNSMNASVTTEPADAPQTANRNPIYNFASASQANSSRLRCSFTTTDVLGNLNDPRLPIYCEPIASDTVNTVYRGRPINMEAEESTTYTNETTSGLGEYFKESVYTINVITAAEVAFNKAEAYLYNLASGDPEQLYEEGINHSLSYYEIPQNEIDAYKSSDGVVYGGSEEENLEKIITQKWIALYQNHIEAWTEIRRTGYPAILLGSSSGETGGYLPRRFTYGESEYNLNFSNVVEAGDRMGEDEYMTRFWWDAKSGVLDIRHPFQDEPSEAWPPN